MCWNVGIQDKQLGAEIWLQGKSSLSRRLQDMRRLAIESKADIIMFQDRFRISADAGARKAWILAARSPTMASRPAPAGLLLMPYSLAPPTQPPAILLTYTRHRFGICISEFGPGRADAVLTLTG